MRLWDTNRVVNVLNGHTNFVTCLTVLPDGVVLASGSADEKIIIWNTGVFTCSAFPIKSCSVLNQPVGVLVSLPSIASIHTVSANCS